MDVLIVYDSVYGNTEQIARSVSKAFGNQEQVVISRVAGVKPAQFAGLRLLIIGSPTQRFKPTPAISNLLNGIPKNSLKGIKVAAFDTRLTQNEIDKTPPLAFFVKLYGYAAKTINDGLKKKGGELIVAPEGFYVEGMEGPLVTGEIERAANWAKQISSVLQRS